MRYIYRFHDCYLDNSEIVVSFCSLTRFDTMSFRVSVPYMNNCINDALRGSNMRCRPMRINGVSFDLYTHELLSLKEIFDYLTK